MLIIVDDLVAHIQTSRPDEEIGPVELTGDNVDPTVVVDVSEALRRALVNCITNLN